MGSSNSDARRPPRRRRPGPSGGHRVPEDLNAIAAGWLFDYAAVQPAEHRRHAYTRAAYAVLGMPQPLRAVHAAGRLLDVRFIGPSTARVLEEVLDTGGSPTIAAAIAASGAAADVAAARALRARFLSMAAAEEVLAAVPRGLVSLDDYAGDLQMHSEWSDGDQTLEDIVQTGLQLGYRFTAVTDHSHGLPVARGMSMETAARQHAAIDAINRAHDGHFVLLKGIEANILGDGSTDLSVEERRAFDLVVAAPHSALRGRVDATRRMVTAVSLPGVDVLGHPRGRKYNSRAGVQADWSAVFAAAAAHEVAVEIDGSPERQDLDWELAIMARDAGCLFALDSDGHSARELLFARMAVAHAVLAELPPERVINCWPVERLLAWTARHRDG